MTPANLGHLALLLAWSVSLALGILPLWAAQRGLPSGMKLAKPLALFQSLLIFTSFACLLWGLGGNDFSIAYVAAHSNSTLPLYYRLAAAWGGHEGSLLLWVFILQLWTSLLVWRSPHWPADTLARVLAVLGLISFGFVSFILFTSDPFQLLAEPVSDGADLNPLLQDAGMIFHPPMLYMGYVGFAITFALAIAALLGPEPDRSWAAWARPWALAAWAFLTAGILLGSFWAYYELGWGGWWFWDAVENASFMPWLVGTALIHSLTATAQREVFKSWSVLLSIVAFSLSLLGTFLVRSGVVTSVHAFASDPARGQFILALLVIVVGGSLSLYAWRAPAWRERQGFSWFSREAALLINNLFLLVAAGSVLLGTLYPLAVEALDMGRISVGPPYFEAVFVPLMLPLLVLLGLGPMLAWKQADKPSVKRRGAQAAAISFLLTLGAALATRSSPLMTLGLLTGIWMLVCTAQLVARQVLGTTAPPSSPKRWAMRAAPRAFWGMVLAHAGMALFVMSVTLLKGLEHSQDQVLKVGNSIQLGDYQFQLTQVEPVAGPNYRAAQARVEVSRHGQVEALLFPQRRLYTVRNMPMTEAAIDRSLLRDLYVSLGEPGPDGQWAMRLQVKPFMSWIWLSCLAMACGGALAATDRRAAKPASSRAQASLQDAHEASLTSSTATA